MEKNNKIKKKSIKTAKIRCENLVLKSKLNDLLSIIVNVEKELESLKTDLNNVKNEHKKSKKGIDYLKNTFDVCRVITSCL